VPKINSGIKIEEGILNESSPKDMNALYLKRDQLDVYTTVPLPEDKFIKKQICHKDLCCDFELEIERKVSAEKVFLRILWYISVSQTINVSSIFSTKKWVLLSVIVIVIIQNKK
jgi:hypothetical protein